MLLKITKILLSCLLGLFAFSMLLMLIIQVPDMYDAALMNKVMVASAKIKYFEPKTGRLEFIGTGWYLKPHDKVYIMTNSHVCEGALNEVYVSEYNDAKPFKGKIIKINYTYDMCLIEAIDNNHKYLKIADKVVDYETVMALGYPYGMPLSLNKGKIWGKTDMKMPLGFADDPIKDARLIKICKNKGFKVEDMIIDAVIRPDGSFSIISKKVCFKIDTPLFTTIISLPGSSGSAIINWKGEVVGILFAGMTKGAGWSFIEPLELIKDFIKDVK